MKIQKIQLGQVIDIVEVNKATYSGNSMGERFITCEIISPFELALDTDCFIDIKLCNLLAPSAVQYTERFYIYSDASITKSSRPSSSGDAFKYTVKFYAKQYELQSMIEMRDIALSQTSFYTGASEYVLYGNVERLCDGIISVINEYKGLTGSPNRGVMKAISSVVEVADETALASVASPSQKTLYITKDDGRTFHYSGTGFVDATTQWNIFIWEDAIDSECYDYNFSSTYVWNALTLVNNEEQLDLEFMVFGSIICIGFPQRTVKDSNNDVYEFMYGTNSLFNISKNVNDGRNVVNRLRAYGSTRNVARYYNSTGRNSGRYVPRLMLPSFMVDGKDYIENTSSQSKYGIHEGSQNFEDIYPSIQNVFVKDMPAPSGTFQGIYTIKVSAVSEKLIASGFISTFNSQGVMMLAPATPHSTIDVVVHNYTDSHDYTARLTTTDEYADFKYVDEGGTTHYLEVDAQVVVSDVRIVDSQSQYYNSSRDDVYWYAPYCYSANNPASAADSLLNEILGVNVNRNEEGEITDFDIFIRDLGFDIEELMFNGGDSVWKWNGTPKFNILDGLLGGLDFDMAENGFVRLTSADAEYAYGARFKVKLVPNTQNEYSVLPTDELICHAGDHFSIYNIDMPNLYVYWAEQRLLVEAQKRLDEIAYPEYQYNIEFDKISLIVNTNLAIQIREGAVMRIKDVNLVDPAIQYIDLPVQSMTIEYNGNQLGYNAGMGTSEEYAADLSNATKQTIKLSPNVEATQWQATVASVHKTEQKVNELTKSAQSGIPMLSMRTIFGKNFNGQNDVRGSIRIENEENSEIARYIYVDGLAKLHISGDTVSDGGITAYFNDSQIPGTILDSIPIDTTTLSKEGGILSVIGGGTPGTTNYNELENKPQIGGVTLQGNKTLAELGIQAVINASNPISAGFISGLASVATSGSYGDLTGKPTKLSDFTNDSGFITGAALTGYATESWVEAKGYLTEHQSLAAYRTAVEQDIIDNALSGRIDKLEHPYISLERLDKYLYRVTFDSLPEDNNGDNPIVGGCSSYVQDGKLYRNLDFNYDNAASFIVRTKEFEGMSFLTGLDDGQMDDEKIAQLPYRIVDGRNKHGIIVSTHVLYNDWSWTGAGNKSISLTRLPFLVLSLVKSMGTIATDLNGVLGNLYAAPSLQATGYLIQVLVTDCTTTYALMPPTTEGQSYVLQDITSMPKLANFRWVNKATLTRSDSALQDRPTGIERWNMMPCPLEDLRFTKAYESDARLSEFIGLRNTTKDSTDAQLEAIYEDAHDEYLDRKRDGVTWQTMHSVVYGDGMESLYIQEDWSSPCRIDHTHRNRNAIDRFTYKADTDTILTGVQGNLSNFAARGITAYASSPSEGSILDSIPIGAGLSVVDNMLVVTGGGTAAVWGQITGTLANQTDLMGALNAKLNKNTAITAGTHTKITYDANGLVTGGTSLSEEDIPYLDASIISTGQFSDAHIASASTWNAKYSKPSGGIPNADLANSSITIGSTQISLGGTSSALNGLTSINGKIYFDDDSINVHGQIEPNINNTHGIGTNTYRFKHLYANAIIGHTLWLDADDSSISLGDDIEISRIDGHLAFGYATSYLFDAGITAYASEPYGGNILDAIPVDATLTKTGGVLSVVGGGGWGSVTSVGLSAPTGFVVSGSPVTISGVLALGFASGYSLPTNAKQSNWDAAYDWVTNDSELLASGIATNAANICSVTDSLAELTNQLAVYLSTLETRTGAWDTAYSWGNHANAGYAYSSSLSNYLPLSGGNITGNLNVSGNVGIGTTSPAYKLDVIGNARVLGELLTRNIYPVASDGSYGLGYGSYNFGWLSLVNDYGSIDWCDGDGTTHSIYTEDSDSDLMIITPSGKGLKVNGTLVSLNGHTHSQYLTGITKAMVEGVLTGNITTHTHSQYLTAHQSIKTINSVALTGSGNITLATLGVAAATHYHSQYAEKDGEYPNMYVGHADEATNATYADDAGRAYEADDADKLGGYLPSYYATANDAELFTFAIAANAATIGSVSDSLSELNNQLSVYLSTLETRTASWDTAYGWGNHASAGYAYASSLGNYLLKSGGTMSGTLTTQNIIPSANGVYSLGDGRNNFGSLSLDINAGYIDWCTSDGGSYHTIWVDGVSSDLMIDTPSGTSLRVNGSRVSLEGHTHSGYLTAHQTITLASGTNNGTLKITTAAGTTDNIAVKGLGSAAYTSSASYASSSHSHTFASITSKPTTIAGYGITDAISTSVLNNYLPKTGGTISGNLQVTNRFTIGSNGDYYFEEDSSEMYFSGGMNVDGTLMREGSVVAKENDVDVLQRTIAANAAKIESLNDTVAAITQQLREYQDIMATILNL